MLQSGHDAVRRLALSLSFSGVWDFDSMSGRRVILLHRGRFARDTLKHQRFRRPNLTPDLVYSGVTSKAFDNSKSGLLQVFPGEGCLKARYNDFQPIRVSKMHHIQQHTGTNPVHNGRSDCYLEHCLSSPMS